VIGKIDRYEPQTEVLHFILIPLVIDQEVIPEKYLSADGRRSKQNQTGDYQTVHRF
jgi:hypothetical protein